MLNDKLEWMYKLRRFVSKLGLDKIKEVMNKLDNPQDKLKFIHIAGTNGKGSTSVMIQSILSEAGYKVGRFNSPHIIDFRERISIDDKWISLKDINRLIEVIKKTEVALTFFEFVTAMALVYFFEQKVDYVVLETGLGGRLDSTNIVNAQIAVITNISLEHTQELGDTISKIAFEKAGIIKPDSIVIYGGDPLLNDIFDKGQKLVNVIFDDKFNYVLGLKGKHQIKNAKVAIACVKELSLSINDKIIKRALEHIKWAGRLEKIGDFILDVAHNPDGMIVLKEYIESKIQGKDLTIIFGILKDKDYLKMLQTLPKHNTLIVTKSKSKRALDPEIIANYAKECIVIDDVTKAIDYVKRNKIKGTILVTGSCYTVSEARAYIYDKYLVI